MSTFKNRIIKIIRPGNFQNTLLRLALKGDTVHCPCCGASYLTFLPAGIEKRANAKCLKCGSLERHRTLWLFLYARTDIFSGQKKILHVAPEIQLYHKFSASKNIDYHPIDLSPEHYHYGAKTIAMDVTALQYADETFDMVICNHVLEHIPDDRAALREMNRVLRKGGSAILNVPIRKDMDHTLEDFSITDPAQRVVLFGQPDHVRLYGNDYIQRLQEAGFLVEEIPFVETFTHNEQFRYGIVPKEIMFYCTKK